MLINGTEHKITLEEAVKWHREMWTWIAEQEESGSCRNRRVLKLQWCEEHGFEDVIGNCFCCEFTGFINGCNKCLMHWKNGDCYTSINRPYDENSVAWLEMNAREIANLPINPIYIK